MRLDPDELLAKLLSDQRLLKLPLVRQGQKLAVGVDEAAWRGLLSES